MKQASKADLPSIPDKKYFSISEVSQLCVVKAYVLRYWEQEFPQLKPVKRQGNRRYYQRQDVILIRQIKRLLYEAGFTIEGARMQLQRIQAQRAQQSQAPVAATNPTKQPSQSVDLKPIIQDLENILESLI